MSLLLIIKKGIYNSKDNSWYLCDACMMSLTSCPNCKRKLKKIPGKTINCSLCGKRIYVRIRVADRKKVLVDLKGMEQIDVEWTKYALRSPWFKTLATFGITEKDYMQTHDGLAKNWGYYPRHRDIFWALLNKLYIAAEISGDSRKGKLLQELMEKFKSEEKRFGGVE